MCVKNNVRLLSLLLAAVLMMTAVFSTAAFPAVMGAADCATSSVSGDVNGDGQLTTTDARDVLRYLLGKVNFYEQQILLVDINGDGLMNTSDVRQMLLIVVGSATMPVREIDLLVYNILSPPKTPL